MTRILIVDDNSDILELTELFLRHAGYDVQIAPDGETALALIQKEPYDVVISDLRLRGRLDGLRVLENHYLQHPNKARILATALGPWTDGRVLALCEKVKASYIPKPFHLGDLLSRIQALAAQTPARREAGAETDRRKPNPVSPGGRAMRPSR
jgi:DNA-binding response OmpR family regulator